MQWQGAVYMLIFYVSLTHALPQQGRNYMHHCCCFLLQLQHAPPVCENMWNSYSLSYSHLKEVHGSQYIFLRLLRKCGAHYLWVN